MSAKKLVTRGWDRDILEAYESGKLPILTINLTKACNFKCIYCHTDAGEKGPDELTAKEWIRVIDESKALGNEVLWVGGRGEPPLDEAFNDVIKHANRKGLTTILNTNGSLITEDKAKLLYENNVSPEVKIISFDESVYDYLAGVKGKLPLLLRGLKNLKNAGYGKIVGETESERITRISGFMLLARPAYDSIPEVVQYCKDSNFTPIFANIVAAGRVVTNRNLEELEITEEENQALLARCSEIMGYPLESGVQECHIQYGMFIQNNGDIIIDRLGLSCDVCDYEGRRAIGNIREISLKEGWKKILEERKKNEEAIARAYNEFHCYSEKCFGSCPMARKSIADYLEKK